MFFGVPLPMLNADLDDDLTIYIIEKRGSNKGPDLPHPQYSCTFVGCHLHRKVVGFAASHEAVNRRVVGSSPT